VTTATRIKAVLYRHGTTFVPICFLGIAVGLVSVHAVLASSSISVLTHCPRPAMWPSPDSCASGERLSVDSISVALPLWMVLLALVSFLLIMPICSALLGLYLREYWRNYGRNLIIE